MNTFSHVVNASEQRSMFDDDVYEITLRIGVMSSADHLQYQVELHNVTSDTLVKMWSMHHADSESYPRSFQTAIKQTVEALESVLNPF